MVITALTRNQMVGCYRHVGSNPTLSAKLQINPVQISSLEKKHDKPNKALGGRGMYLHKYRRVPSDSV